MYPPCTGSGIWAVPVFPATVYPGTPAVTAVPSWTTCSIIVVSCDGDLLGERPVRWPPARVLVTDPSVATVAWTSRGGTNTPPVATVFTMSRTCWAVTASSWPMGVEPMSETCHVAGSLLTNPADSAGKPSPVVRPKPERGDLRRQPTLAELLGDLDGPDVRRLGEDRVAESRSVGWLSASWNTHPSMVRVLGTVNTSSGEMIPSWSAAENVTSLNTDPGSYTWVRARFCGAWTTVVTGGGRGRRGGGRGGATASSPPGWGRPAGWARAWAPGAAPSWPPGSPWRGCRRCGCS